MRKILNWKNNLEEKFSSCSQKEFWRKIFTAKKNCILHLTFDGKISVPLPPNVLMKDQSYSRSVFCSPKGADKFESQSRKPSSWMLKKREYRNKDFEYTQRDTQGCKSISQLWKLFNFV